MRSVLPALLLLSGCSEYEIRDFEIVDVFNQNPAEAVDILLVVDNSCSMGPYQLQLGANFDAFITWFIDANVDYQIAVTTTSLERPPHDPVNRPECSQADISEIPLAGHLVGGKIITPETEDAASLFQSVVNVGVCGGGFEMGLEAGRLAVSPALTSGVNTGFLREDASLSLIFVSDEEDASPDPVHTYINDFYEVKGQRTREVFNASALTVTDVEDCIDGAGSSPGTRYVDVARQTAGVVGNLCSQDFEPIVNELSLNASRLRDVFHLSEMPDLATLRVSVRDQEIPCDDGAWVYELVEAEGVPVPSIRFLPDALPQPGDRVSARYDAGDGDPAAFCGGAP